MSRDKKFDLTESNTHGGMTDVMVDIETTGLNTKENAIVQIGAQKFNIESGALGDKFIINVAILEGRTWMESTRAWWDSQDKEIREGVFDKPYAADVALNAFANWCFPTNSLRFWGKGGHFDYPFIEGYFSELKIPNPFFYRVATDMNSFVRGMYYPRAIQEVTYDDSGDAHNALADAENQLKYLQAHIANVRANA